MQIVFASHNVGKIKELMALTAQLNVEIIPQTDLNLPSIEETGLTFVENALLKARHLSAHTGLACIADDSGLEVPALDGQPGIYSARFAGEGATDQQNIAKLLTQLRNKNISAPQAFFRCALVFMLHPHDPTPLICEGRWEGTILTAPQGVQGFGYDPVFFVPTENKTAAELLPERKNTISHRAQAMQNLITRLPEKLRAPLC